MSPRWRGTIGYETEASLRPLHFTSNSGASAQSDGGTLSMRRAWIVGFAEFSRTIVMVPETESAAASRQLRVIESCAAEGRLLRSTHQAISANRFQAARA